MSLVPIMGNFYLNKNLAVEFACYLDPTDIVHLAGMSRRSYELYSQDIIWWIHLNKSFPELR